MTELRVVHTEEEIRARVREIAERIAADYAGKRLVLVGILKGVAFLVADLARAVGMPVDFEFVDVTTTLAERGEVVQLTYATNVDVHGRHVLVLKDVLHSGVTENYLITHLSQHGPASIEVLAAVDKPQQRRVNLTARYALFTEVPEGFLVGYGLGGSRTQHANRPDLCVLDEQP